MILFLDATDYNAIRFALTDGKVVRQQKHQLKYNENDKTLLLLDKFLKKHNLSLRPVPRSKIQVPRIDKVLVCTGPGSFTGTRVGVTIALALRLALDVKVGGIKKSQIPSNLRKLLTLKGSKDLKVSYNRPAL